MISSCCGATPRNFDNDCDSTDIGICPQCGEHCDWEDEEETQDDLGTVLVALGTSIVLVVMFSSGVWR